MLTHTLRLGESQPTRGPKRLAQPDYSDVNIYKSSSRPSVKGMDTVEESSADLHLTPEVRINQFGERDKFSNYNSWKYLTEFILDTIKATILAHT